MRWEYEKELKKAIGPERTWRKAHRKRAASSVRGSRKRRLRGCNWLALQTAKEDENFPTV